MLTERYYSWEEARKLANNDSEVDLSGEGVAYTPSEDAFEEEPLGEEAYEAGEAEPREPRSTTQAADVASLPQQTTPAQATVR